MYLVYGVQVSEAQAIRNLRTRITSLHSHDTIVCIRARGRGKAKGFCVPRVNRR